MALADLIANFQSRQPNFVDTFNRARGQSMQMGLIDDQRQAQQQALQKQSRLADLLSGGANPQQLAQAGYLPEAKALSEIGNGGKPFEGTGMDAQVLNILNTGDPSSKEYATAYTYYTQPKTQMTPEGMIQINPKLPPGIQPPTFGGGVSDEMPKGQRQGEKPFLSANQLKYNQGYNEVANLTDAYNRYMTVAEEVIPENPSDWTKVTGEQLGRLRSAYGNLTLAAKGPALLELGVLSGPDLEQIEQIFPNPIGFKTNLVGKDYALSSVNEAGKNLANRIGRLNETFSGGTVNVKQPPKINDYSSKGKSSLSSEDQQAINWAKQNPNDPRAAQIFQLHGIR